MDRGEDRSWGVSTAMRIKEFGLCPLDSGLYSRVSGKRAMIRCVIGDGFEQDRPVGRLALLSGGHDEGASRCGSRI